MMEILSGTFRDDINPIISDKILTDFCLLACTIEPLRYGCILTLVEHNLVFIQSKFQLFSPKVISIRVKQNVQFITLEKYHSKLSQRQ